MLHINILSWSRRWLTSRHCRLEKQFSIKFNSVSCIVHFNVMWVIHILHRWDCRASFTTLKQSYSKHMQRKRERTHDARQNRMLNSPRQHDGKGSMRLMLMRIPFKDHCSAHTHTHTQGCTHTTGMEQGQKVWELPTYRRLSNWRIWFRAQHFTPVVVN